MHTLQSPPILSRKPINISQYFFLVLTTQTDQSFTGQRQGEWAGEWELYLLLPLPAYSMCLRLDFDKGVSLACHGQKLRPFIAFCHRQFFANISQFMKPRCPPAFPSFFPFSIFPFQLILLPFALFILLHLTLLMNYWPQQMAASAVAFPSPLRGTSKAFCLSSAKPFLRFPINFSFALPTT